VAMGVPTTSVVDALPREINFVVASLLLLPHAAPKSLIHSHYGRTLGLPFGLTRCSMSSLPRWLSVDQRGLQRLGARLL
jgi:hypothetical protein